MLVLSRKTDESILVFRDGELAIKICVVRLQGDKARLGIEADGAYEILREELFRPQDLLLEADLRSVSESEADTKIIGAA